MSVFQLLSVLFGLFMLYVVRIHYRKKTLTLSESSFWSSTWFLFVIISIFPSLVQGISNLLSFARIFDLVVVIAFMILTTISFFNYLQNKSLESKIERYIRQKALTKAKKSS
ncbi:MAG: hypothetical protein COY81_00180 [Candidatus Pacebacteria bacterium CG_4_10_14_0_8_um_filter_43_12]|nr:MAG: hypothetical protein COY81_00180 [Candidatus Pacebacteria bacterium CG_4_10_14_0_8_um_filter_43_12]